MLCCIACVSISWIFDSQSMLSCFGSNQRQIEALQKDLGVSKTTYIYDSGDIAQFYSYGSCRRCQSMTDSEMDAQSVALGGVPKDLENSCVE